MISNLQPSQSRESRQIQHCEVRVTNTIVNDDLRHRIVQRDQLINTPNSCIVVVPRQIRMLSQSTNVYWSFQSHTSFLNTERPSRRRMQTHWESRYWDWACLQFISEWMKTTLKNEVTSPPERGNRLCGVCDVETSSECCEFGQV